MIEPQGGPGDDDGTCIIIWPWWDSSTGADGWDGVCANFPGLRDWMVQTIQHELNLKPGTYQLVTPIVMGSGATPFDWLPQHKHLPTEFRIQDFLASDLLENAHAVFSFGSRSLGYYLYDLWKTFLPRLQKNCPIYFTRLDKPLEADYLVPSLFRNELESVLVQAGVLPNPIDDSRSTLTNDSVAATDYFSKRLTELSPAQYKEERWYAIDGAVQYYTRVTRSRAAAASYAGETANRFPTRSSRFSFLPGPRPN